MAGVYIFAVILIASIVVFTVYKLKWNKADRKEERSHNQAFQDELAEEKRKRQAKIKPE